MLKLTQFYGILLKLYCLKQWNFQVGNINKEKIEELFQMYFHAVYNIALSQRPLSRDWMSFMRSHNNRLS